MGATGPDYQGHYLTTGRFVAFFVIVICLLGVANIVVNGDAGSSPGDVLGLLAVALVAYVLGVRPGVLEDVDGVRVRNPLRTSMVPWGSVTDVDVTDVLRVHTGDGVVRCFAVPRRRPSPTQSGRTTQNYGFPTMTPGAPGLGARSAGPPISRAEALSVRLRHQAERFAVASGSGPPTTRYATDALVALGVAAVLLAVAVLLS